MAQGLMGWRENCVTCDRWGGSRKLSRFHIRAEYTDNNVKGKCTDGVWKREKTTPMQTCAQWVKWSTLK